MPVHVVTPGVLTPKAFPWHVVKAGGEKSSIYVCVRVKRPGSAHGVCPGDEHPQQAPECRNEQGEGFCLPQLLCPDTLTLLVGAEAVTAVPEHGHRALQRSSGGPANAVPPAAFVRYVRAAAHGQAQGCSPSQPDATKSCEVILSKYNIPLSRTCSLWLGTAWFPVQSWLASGRLGYGQSLPAKCAVMFKSNRAGGKLNLTHC